MRFVLFIFIFLCLNFGVSAGLFGPSNYHECIKDGLKDARTNKALAMLKRSCMAEFPEKNSSFNKYSKLLKSCGVKGYSFEHWLPNFHEGTKKITKSLSYTYDANYTLSIQNNSAYDFRNVRIGLANSNEQCKNFVVAVECTRRSLLSAGGYGNFVCTRFDDNMVKMFNEETRKSKTIGACILSVNFLGLSDRQIYQNLYELGFCKQ